MRILPLESNYNLQNKNYYAKQPSFGWAWENHASWGASYIAKTGKTNFKLFSFPDVKAVLLELTKNPKLIVKNWWEHGLKVKDPEKLAGATTAAAIASISTLDKDSKLIPMENKGEGIFELDEVNAKPGDGYRFVIVRKDGTYDTVKDPYTKKQINIHGWSSVYDQNAYEWKNTDWIEGKDPRRIKRQPAQPLRGLGKLVIDEINIPTLSLDGTFDGAKARIDEIANKKNATAIEIMPVENTFSLQWGYDGVDKFAVNEKMGGPDKLKELIDYAHGKGLNVIMDMVPNHIGPDGNYMGKTGPYVKHSSEFGDVPNYEGENGKYVRDWMTNAALWWANEFKVDGIRLDLTSRAESDWLIRQIVIELNHHNPDVFIIAEDHQHKRHSITTYWFNNKISHDDNLNYIDTTINNNRKGFDPVGPESIGVDSEWDSQYKDSIIKMLLTPNNTLLDEVDKLLPTSHYRVHYAYSHDEIGNEDGTRFIPKYISRHFDLYNRVYGSTDSEKGQKAAHVAQKLAELTVSKEFEDMSNKDLYEKENEMGINSFISHYDLENAFKTAVAKQKLMLGTLMTTPGPKMFFQGDDEADLSYFKFFREHTEDRAIREADKNKVNEIIANKGYDTFEELARPDSILGRVKPDGMFKKLKNQMLKFSADLRKILDEHSALVDGNIIHTYKDNNHNVHIHQIKSGDDELLIIKNFGHGFHDNNYEYYGFPQDSVWTEIFSSDDKKYGGMGYVNTDRKDITNINQHLSLAPNSFIILKKIG